MLPAATKPSMTPALILFSFALFAALMLARRLPALLAVPGMALAIAASARVPLREVLGTVIEGGAVALAPYYIAVFFGALLGRVLMETRVAEELVKQAAEFAGDSPLAVLAVVSVVTAALFTSLSGLGAIIMLGTIVFPILLSMGVAREFAATMFLMAYGAGFAVNVSMMQFYRGLVGGISNRTALGFALPLMAINVLAAAAFFMAGARRYRRYAFWAEADPAALRPARDVGSLGFLAPLVPLSLYAGLGWPASSAFLGGVLFALLAVRPAAPGRLVVRCALRGLEDAAPSMLLMIGVGMLLKVSSLPAIRDSLKVLLSHVSFSGRASYVLFFTLAAPLVLYRGPMNPLGAGAGVYAAFYALGLLPAPALFAALLCLAQVQAVTEPTNTHNVWVGGYLGVGVNTIARRTFPWMMAVAVAGLVLAARFYL